MVRFLTHFRLALWRAFQHDAFDVAKAAAFSAILTLFPAILVSVTLLSISHTSASLLREISHALGKILPEGTSEAVLQYFTGNKPVSVKLLVTVSVLTLWTGSGVMISWMQGFRNAYQMPKVGGLVRERLIALLLVVLAGIPMVFASFILVFGNQIESWIVYRAGHELGPYILGLWAALRWIIATLTSIAVIGLVFHYGVPRTQPWHRVLPGSVLATVLWFVSTVVFGLYLRSFANYNAIYGSVATAIALLIWLYLVSMVILIGAEFNAVRYPRFLFGAHSDLAESRRVEERERGS
jgi:membrane protein